MQYRVVLQVIGRLLLLLAVIMLIPMGVALLYGDGAAFGEVRAFVFAIVATGGVGLLLFWVPADLDRLSGREGFAIVTLGWVACSCFGALPFWLAQGAIPSYVDAFFESMSGFTTTGASILTDIERLPHGLLFWRSMTHWLGGMGIVVLTVAILPSLGAAGFQMMRAEVPGPADRLRPRITATAKLLWGVYVLFTLLEVLLLRLGGMDLFESFCHTFGTIATGGFSTRNASIGAYGSAYIEWVIIVFMTIGALSFVLHYRFLSGQFGCYWRNEEARLCLGIVAAATAFVAFALWQSAAVRGAHDILRTALFQVLTIISTTGYATADFDSWPVAVRWLLLMLMFLGGSAGSTAGALKVFRVLLLFKVAVREVRRLLSPRRVMAIKLDGRPVEQEVISGVIAVTVLYLLVFIVATMLVGATLPDTPQGAGSPRALETAASAVAASIGCVGPGLAGVGPTANYAWMPALTKLLLCLCMLLGRLEVVTVLVLLAPHAWRR